MQESIIGLGMAAIGRPEYININVNPILEKTKTKEAFRENALSLLSEAYDSGIRYFDSAPGYGAAEEFLLEWAKQHPLDSVQFATKWGYTYVADWKANATTHEVKEHSLSKLNEQWEYSKQLLPQLNVYQIHSATFESGVLENKEVLNRLGKLKKEHNLTIGLTTSGPQQGEVLNLAKDIKFEGDDLFTCYQVTYNVLEQSTATILKELSDQGKFIVIKEAMANGRIFPEAAITKYSSIYKLLNQLANKYQVGIDAIAIRFCIDSVHPSVVLSGAFTSSHLKQNLKALSFKLTTLEVEELSTVLSENSDYWSERKQLEWN